VSKYVSSLLFPVLLGLVTVSSPANANDASTERDNLNGGYYLLHKLCDDEAQLPLLMDIKTTPKEIDAFAIRISQTAKESLATLDRLKSHDKNLDFDQNPLPKIEQDVRDSIKGEKQHQLLFGTTGPDFARAVLVSQIEASSYAENLSKVLAAQEKDSDRSKSLGRMADKWRLIHDQAFALLKHY
jgi:hypothetical protein